MPVCWCRWWRCLGKWLVWCCQSDETANTKLRTKRRAPQKTVTASTTRHVCSSCSSARPLAARHSYVLACLAGAHPAGACPKNVTRQVFKSSVHDTTKPVKLLTVAHLRELTTTPRLVSRLRVLAAMASAVVVRPLPSAQPAQPHSLQCTVVRVVVSRTSRRPARRLNGCVCVCECLCEGVRVLKGHTKCADRS